MSNPSSSPASASSSTPSPVACAGMIVVDHLTPPMDRLPNSGELIAVDGLVLNIGGGAANTAMALSRLSVPASICARVGDDAFGRYAVETLQSGGVDCGAVKTDGRRETSQTLVLNVKGEDRRFIHSIGANLGFIPSDMDEALASSPRVLHIGYFLILPELDADGLAKRFAQVRKTGGQTLLDVVTPGPGAYIEPLRKVLPHTDVFVPNTDEAALILGETDPFLQARAFHEMGAQRVVITRGEHGLISYSAENQLRMDAFPVDFVDASGGGDAFNAGYILGLLEKRSEVDCLKLASAVGASCVRAVGTTAGVFTRAEAEEFLRRHPISLEPVAG